MGPREMPGVREGQVSRACFGSTVLGGGRGVGDVKHRPSAPSPAAELPGTTASPPVTWCLRLCALSAARTRRQVS